MRSLAEKGIGTQVHYIPVPRHPYYQDLGYKPEDYPETENYYNEALTIPIYYGLTQDQINGVVSSLNEVLA